MSRKTTAYARKIRRTGPGFNGAAWMNTMERCRPYTDEPIMLAANEALKRIRERHDRLGKWALDGPAVVELLAAVDVYQEILMASSPAQMSNAGKVRMDVIAGKRSKIIEAPQRSNA